MKEKDVPGGSASSLEISRLIPGVIEAGACIMLHRGSGVTAELKGDASPVTAAVSGRITGSTRNMASSFISRM